VNQFLGKTKQIVDDKPGTTRDPVDVVFKYHGQTLRLIDTAGIRRKSRVSYVVDKYSMIAALKSIERSDVVLMMIDAVEGVVEQDARIAGYIVDRGKALVIVINKWDLIQKDSMTMKHMEREIRDKLKFLDFAPIIFVSALSGQRVTTIIDKINLVYKEYSKRIQTADLNKILQSITVRHTPPSTGNRQTKIFYSTQVSTKPPSFMITTNFPKSINLSYKRYIIKQFRYFFNFEGTPIRIFWRAKSKKNPYEKDNDS
jgi:GTP-binding protein